MSTKAPQKGSVVRFAFCNLQNALCLIGPLEGAVAVLLKYGWFAAMSNILLASPQHYRMTLHCVAAKAEPSLLCFFFSGRGGDPLLCSGVIDVSLLTQC